MLARRRCSPTLGVKLSGSQQCLDLMVESKLSEKLVVLTILQKLLDVQASSGRVAVVVAGVLPEFPGDGVQLVSGLVSSSVPPVSSPVST